MQMGGRNGIVGRSRFFTLPWGLPIRVCAGSLTVGMCWVGVGGSETPPGGEQGWGTGVVGKAGDLA